MYDEHVTYSTPPGTEPGPLKKYDKYAGTEDPAVSAWKYEYDNYRYTAGTGGTAGMCDATSWAGFIETRPSGDKTLNSVVYRKQAGWVFVQNDIG